MHLGTRGSDFAPTGLKEIQMVSSVTHSTVQNTGVLDSAPIFDVQLNIQWIRHGQ